MLQSSGKVTRKRVRPATKLSNQKSDNDVALVAATNHQMSSGNNGASPSNKSGNSPATLPAEVEQIFEVNYLKAAIQILIHEAPV